MTVRFTLALSIALAAAVSACASSASSAGAAPTPAASPSSTSAKTSTWDGVYSAAQAQHGATLFASTCNRCHGAAAEGTPDDGGRLVGKEFFAKYDGVSLDQLFTAIQTLMPADHPNTLPPKDVADITAYLLSQNQMPAGPAPLSADPAQLKALRITATKP